MCLVIFLIFFSPILFCLDCITFKIFLYIFFYCTVRRTWFASVCCLLIGLQVEMWCTRKPCDNISWAMIYNWTLSVIICLIQPSKSNWNRWFYTKQHVPRASWQTKTWTAAHIPKQEIPEPVGNGWVSKDGTLTPLYFEGSTALDKLKDFHCGRMGKNKCEDEEKCPCHQDSVGCSNISRCGGAGKCNNPKTSENGDVENPDVS